MYGLGKCMVSTSTNVYMHVSNTHTAPNVMFVNAWILLFLFIMAAILKYTLYTPHA